MTLHLDLRRFHDAEPLTITSLLPGVMCPARRVQGRRSDGGPDARECYSNLLEGRVEAGSHDDDGSCDYSNELLGHGNGIAKGHII